MPWKRLATEDDISAKKNGTYTLSRFTVNGFITGQNSFRFWLPVPCLGKNVSISAGGTVSIRTPSGKAVVNSANHSASTMSV